MSFNEFTMSFNELVMRLNELAIIFKELAMRYNELAKLAELSFNKKVIRETTRKVINEIN